MCFYHNKEMQKLISQNSIFTQIITIKYFRHSEVLFLLDFLKKQAVLTPIISKATVKLH